VVGALLVGAVWVGKVFVDHSESQAVTGGSHAGLAQTVGQHTSGDDSSSSDRRGERCREVYDAQSAPLAAARPALDQWAVHIGAMNKLVLGVISLRQAQRFWNQSRLGAMRSIAAYQQARHRFVTGLTARCPQWRSPDARSHERPCVRAAGLRARQLAAADVAIRTWRHHVHDMERLRRGTLSPADATAMWLEMWHRGVRQLHDYRAAARAAAAVSCNA
jgi:hypothetical protein